MGANAPGRWQRVVTLFLVAALAAAAPRLAAPATDAGDVAALAPLLVRPQSRSLVLKTRSGAHAWTADAQMRPNVPPLDGIALPGQDACAYRTPRLLPYDPCGNAPLIPAWPGVYCVFLSGGSGMNASAPPPAAFRPPAPLPTPPAPPPAAVPAMPPSTSAAAVGRVAAVDLALFCCGPPAGGL